MDRKPTSKNFPFRISFSLDSLTCLWSFQEQVGWGPWLVFQQEPWEVWQGVQLFKTSLLWKVFLFDLVLVCPLLWWMAVWDRQNKCSTPKILSRPNTGIGAIVSRFLIIWKEQVVQIFVLLSKNQFAIGGDPCLSLCVWNRSGWLPPGLANQDLHRQSWFPGFESFLRAV